jgi:hypothetical protein
MNINEIIEKQGTDKAVEYALGHILRMNIEIAYNEKDYYICRDIIMTLAK